MLTKMLHASVEFQGSGDRIKTYAHVVLMTMSKVSVR